MLINIWQISISDNNISRELSKKINGLEVELISEDALEVFWDENSIGQKITRPYRFALDGIEPGRHKLKLVISSTSGNILDVPSPWGVKAIKWLSIL